MKFLLLKQWTYTALYETSFVEIISLAAVRQQIQHVIWGQRKIYGHKGCRCETSFLSCKLDRMCGIYTCLDRMQCCWEQALVVCDL